MYLITIIHGKDEVKCFVLSEQNNLIVAKVLMQIIPIIKNTVFASLN